MTGGPDHPFGSPHQNPSNRSTEPSSLASPEPLDTLAARAAYPIQTFEELAAALGGPDATVTVQGRSIRVSEARTLLPRYYFPIESEADFVSKIADLGVRTGLTEAEWHDDWRRRSEGGQTDFRADCWS